MVYEDCFVLQASLTSSNFSNNNNKHAGITDIGIRTKALKKWRSSFGDSTASANRRPAASRLDWDLDCSVFTVHTPGQWTLLKKVGHDEIPSDLLLLLVLRTSDLMV